MATSAAEPQTATSEPVASELPSHDAAVTPDTMFADREKGEDSLSAREDKEEEEPDFASGFKVLVLMTALLLCQFLVALDMVRDFTLSLEKRLLTRCASQSIIATAIPKITSEFHSLDQVGWYGSGFLLTLAGFVSFWGKAFKHASIKWVFLTAVFVFEVGSLICGKCYYFR